jgi:hypothetical protein
MLTTPSCIIAATFAALTLTATPALALPPDPPAAQTRDLAAGTGPLTLAPDQRSPDARVNVERLAPATIAQDQRSADARDAGGSARPIVVTTAAPADAGFDWDAAVIGAAGALAIAVIAGAGIALLRRRSPQPVV